MSVLGFVVVIAAARHLLPEHAAGIPKAFVPNATAKDAPARDYEPSPYFFTTKSYQEAALTALIEEANRLARDFSLQEQLPITRSNLTEIYIAEPASRMLGTISTTNYAYVVRSGFKFAELNQIGLPKIWTGDAAGYRLPTSLVNTNSALNKALQMMKHGGIDVDRLNTDCEIEIRATMPDGPKGKYFVPNYWIVWRRQGRSVALMTLFLPTTTIRMLQIYDPQYVLRKAVEVPNMAELLLEGNPPRILIEKLGLIRTNTLCATNGSTPVNQPNSTSPGHRKP